MIDLKNKSIEIIKKYQHPSGSYVACPKFNTYNYCWLRDGSFIAYSMDISGEFDSAGKYFDWVDMVISKQYDKVEKIIGKANKCEPLLNSDYLPTRYTLDGKENQDEWPNFQLDGYGTWLWALCEHIKYSGKTELIKKYKRSINITVKYLINFWNIPNYDCWEENGDKIHTSTLACIYGGLDSISNFIDTRYIRNTVNQIKEFIQNNCIIVGRLTKYVGTNNIDASLLWAAIPFSVFDANDKITVATINEIERRLLHNGGVHRYPEDTYYGGGEWLLLSCWLGWYYVKTGQVRKADSILEWVERHTNENGEMPEQILEHVNNAEYIEQWRKLWGEVATPLLWSHAMYLVLLKMN